MQDFAAECYDQKSGAKVKGMPRVIETKSVLAEILASIIFVCGPGHGAINFAQYDYMAFVPNMPLSLYQDVSIIAEQETPITEEQLMTVCFLFLPDLFYLMPPIVPLSHRTFETANPNVLRLTVHEAKSSHTYISLMHLAYTSTRVCTLSTTDTEQTTHDNKRSSIFFVRNPKPKFWVLFCVDSPRRQTGTSPAGDCLQPRSIQV